MRLSTTTGLLDQAQFIESPNCDEREWHSEPEVIIVHCISLPPGEYGGDEITRFFQNQLNAGEHPYFESMAHLTVSSHFLVQRNGNLLQFVPTNLRAWHAGESTCLGKPKVNDFSIGIELEGLDTDREGFTDKQYSALNKLIAALQECYPSIKAPNIFAHSDIAPGRKPDPGPYFNWGNVSSLK